MAPGAPEPDGADGGMGRMGRNGADGADFDADCADYAPGCGRGRCYVILVFTEFHGILRNSAEFACMERFI